MLTFVALGDSTTAGVGDPMPDGTWRGWAALLAEGLGAPGDVAFHNLARSGALTGDVATEQLPAALARRPQVAALVVGVNDTLRGAFDGADVGRLLDRTVGALTGGGAVVLTACLPDPGRMFRLPGVLARPLGRRIAAVNAAVHRAALRHGALHLHIPELPGAYDAPMWSVDRLHPGERGHRLLAGAAYDTLVAAGMPGRRRPDADPGNPPPGRRARLRWLATRGTRWALARSTDLLPDLARLAVAEWRGAGTRGVRPEAYAEAGPRQPARGRPGVR